MESKVMFLKFKGELNIMYFYNKESAGDYGIYTKIDWSMFEEQEYTEEDF